jgi:hypothetical protein
MVRRWLARRLYRKLKMEARSVEHVKKLNKGLENKIISLQHKIEELVSGWFSNWRLSGNTWGLVCNVLSGNTWDWFVTYVTMSGKI